MTSDQYIVYEIIKIPYTDKIKVPSNLLGNPGTQQELWLLSIFYVLFS